MNELQELRELVEELKNINEDSKMQKDERNKKTVEKLQKINEKILKSYCVMVGDFKIEPLLIEAYYTDINGSCFDGKIVHAARGGDGKMVKTAEQRQKYNFGKLYIHNVKNKDDGLDLCLSNGDYYYSVLIKNAILSNKGFATQSQVSMGLCGGCKRCNNVDDCIYNDTIVLKKNNTVKTSKAVHFPRKNVAKSSELATFSLESMKEYKLTFKGGKGKAVIKYIKEHKDEFASKEAKIVFAKEYANYCPEKIRNNEI